MVLPLLSTLFSLLYIIQLVKHELHISRQQLANNNVTTTGTTNATTTIITGDHRREEEGEEEEDSISHNLSSCQSLTSDGGSIAGPSLLPSRSACYHQNSQTAKELIYANVDVTIKDVQ